MAGTGGHSMQREQPSLVAKVAEHWHPFLYRIAWQSSQNRDVVEESVQTAIEQALAKEKTDPSAFQDERSCRNWTAIRVRGEVLDQIRKKSKRNEETLTLQTEPDDQRILDPAALASIRECVNQLEGADRLLLRRHFGQSYNNRELAASYGVSDGRMSRRIARACGRLFAVMVNAGFEAHECTLLIARGLITAFRQDGGEQTDHE